VRPEFDVFQLGSLLWHLYRYQDQQGSRTFCSLAGCDNANNVTCDEHGDPVALPNAASDVPDNLDRVIALCRLEDPRRRPAAWELVLLFPTDEKISQQIRELNSDEAVNCRTINMTGRLTGLEDVRELYGYSLICSLCRERCHDVFYKCEVCHSANYDLCNRCSDKGEHWLDNNHSLAQFYMKAFRDNTSGGRISYY
jgi:hypothetical protein